MMGKQSGQIQMVILDIDSMIPEDHLLRRKRFITNRIESALLQVSEVSHKSWSLTIRLVIKRLRFSVKKCSFFIPSGLKSKSFSIVLLPILSVSFYHTYIIYDIINS